MAIPSPPSPTRLTSQSQLPTQTQTQTQTQNQTQKPTLSVSIQQPASSTQSLVPIAPAMPSSQPRQIPQSPSQRNPPKGAEDVTAPPHSPISPKGIAAKLADMKPYNPPNVISKPPPPVPIAESDNVDVIALRSALMILQVQRESARRDIKELQELKEEAFKDPEAYVQELVRRSKLERSQQQAQEQPQKSANEGGAVKEDLLAPTMRYLVDGLGKESDFLQSSSKGQMADLRAQKSPISKEKVSAAAARTGEQERDDEGSSGSEDESSTKSRFAAVPKAQNVYRMPPVNWAKYQLSGVGLEKLHHDQQTRPTAGKPVDPVIANAGDAALTERYVLAAPYEPVVDAVRMGHPSDHPMQTRRKGNRK